MCAVAVPLLRQVTCHCEMCSASLAGQLKMWTPTDFERHGGMGTSRKWKNSIKVAAQVSWLRPVIGCYGWQRHIGAKPTHTMAACREVAARSG